MNANTAVHQPTDEPDLRRAIVRRLIQVVIQFLLIAVILFVASGRLHWVWAWAYVAAAIILFVVKMIVRTVLEDRTLQERLVGYREYAGRVRARLGPGVW